MYGLERESAERVEPFEYGYLVLNPSSTHDPGFLVIDREGIEPEEAAAAAEELLRPFNPPRPSLAILDPAHGTRLDPGLRELGWSPEHGIYQVLRTEPDREPVAEVREVPYGEVLDLRRAALAEDDWIRDLARDAGAPVGEVVEQVLKQEIAMTEVGGDRGFVATHGGEPASICQLYSRDGIGMVENVATLERARNRGLARAVVLAAARSSQADGNELTFLGAEEDDWPQKLYERLGFESVGREHIYEKRPPKRQ